MRGGVFYPSFFINKKKNYKKQMSRLTGSEAKSLKEAYNAVYTSQEVSQELQEEVVEENIEQLDEIAVNFGGQAALAAKQKELAQQRQSQSRIDALRQQRFGSGGAPSAGKTASGTPSTTTAKAAPAPAPGAGTAASRYTAKNLGAAQYAAFKGGGGLAAMERKGQTAAQVIAQGRKNIGRFDGGPRVGTAPTAPAARPAATTPKATPSAATPAKPAAPQGTIKDGSAAGKPAATPAAPQRTFNPLMQKTFGYQTGNAPDQIAKASQGSSQAAADAAFKRSREMVNKMRSAATISQSFDPFDVIKGHLLDEGYAETEEAAIAIMAHMGEGWKQSILEGNLGGSAPNLPSSVVKFVDELPANVQKMTQGSTAAKTKPGTAQSTRMYGRY